MRAPKNVRNDRVASDRDTDAAAAAAATERGLADGQPGAARGAQLLVLAALACSLVSVAVPTALPPVAASSADLPASGDRAWIVRHLGTINPHLSERSRERITAAILRSSADYGLDPELVVAVLEVESDARPWARSPKGAVGLMQVMPHMIEPLDLAGSSLTYESNIEAGCRILADNIRRLGEADGISAYFWGSRIRGGRYLEKVLQTRAEIRRLRVS